MGWWMEDGLPHVLPPPEVLEGMIALRIHLDDCGPENGPLRVMPGSHRGGRLTFPEIDQWRRRVSEVVCCVRAGDVLAMRPLLLHASSTSTLPARRRIIHIEYAGAKLPDRLHWFEWAARIPVNEA